jgi:hypothetical protein
MDDNLVFYVGFFCFVMAIVGVIMTILEFKNMAKNSDK